MTQPHDEVPPPGWYPDPGYPAQQRWWDGRQWTMTWTQFQAIGRANKSSRTATIAFSVVGGVLLLLLVVGIIASPARVGTSARPRQDTSPGSAPGLTTTSAPTAPTTTTEAPPTTAPPPESQVRSAIDDRVEVQEVQVFPDGQIFVTWHIRDNLTEGLTKASARHDATYILQGVRHSGVPFTEVRLIGKADLVDQLGRTSTDTVVVATYPKSTVDAIQFDNFDKDNIFKPGVADTADLHPAIRE